MAYDIDFLGHGVEAPLPTFGPELDGDIVRSSHLRDEIYADVDTDGSFGFSRLAPGVAEIRVRLSYQEAVLVSVPRVQVRPGKNEDGRLRPLDLTKVVGAHAITVTDASGEPEVGAVVHFRPTGHTGEWNEIIAGATGRVVVAGLGAGTDVLVGHEGHRFAQLDDQAQRRCAGRRQPHDPQTADLHLAGDGRRRRRMDRIAVPRQHRLVVGDQRSAIIDQPQCQIGLDAC